jgi:hypothetical protein
MEPTGSPLLERDPRDWVRGNGLAFAIRDAFPVSPGHTLVVPRRQLDSSATPPQGDNIGFNVVSLDTREAGA